MTAIAGHDNMTSLIPNEVFSFPPSSSSTSYFTVEYTQQQQQQQQLQQRQQQQQQQPEDLCFLSDEDIMSLLASVSEEVLASVSEEDISDLARMLGDEGEELQQQQPSLPSPPPLLPQQQQDILAMAMNVNRIQEEESPLPFALSPQQQYAPPPPPLLPPMYEDISDAEVEHSPPPHQRQPDPLLAPPLLKNSSSYLPPIPTASLPDSPLRPSPPTASSSAVATLVSKKNKKKLNKTAGRGLGMGRKVLGKPLSLKMTPSNNSSSTSSSPSSPPPHLPTSFPPSPSPSLPIPLFYLERCTQQQQHQQQQSVNKANIAIAPAVAAKTRHIYYPPLQSSKHVVYDEHLPKDISKITMSVCGGMTGEPFTVLNLKRWTADYIRHLPADIVKRTLLEKAIIFEGRGYTSLVNNACKFNF